MSKEVKIRKYNEELDEQKLLKLISYEEGWDYADEDKAENYSRALANSITFVAVEGDELCGYSRSINDNDLFLYVCDLLVGPNFRGKQIGRLLMERVLIDFPGYEVFVMSDVDEYYKKLGYILHGSIFQVMKGH